MSEPFKIYIDRLRGGANQVIDAQLDPSFLDVNEPDLSFPEPVQLKGDAYLTDEHLIIHLKASTKAIRLCAICNQPTPTEVVVHNFYHTEMIQDIPSAVFDFREVLREALLIEIPLVVECNAGKCPEREAIAPFMSSKERKENPTYFPFTDIDM
ncbi:MAG TPA: hypothetical protein DCE71_05875 [Parachlamydiales bacterium]|nr:hypothetical protein [Parachlamydiales bacterium]